jgi:hypothetical protein
MLRLNEKISNKMKISAKMAQKNNRFLAKIAIKTY